jgi:hypothetical protein
LSKACSLSKEGIGFAGIWNSKRMIPMMTIAITVGFLLKNQLKVAGERKIHVTGSIIKEILTEIFSIEIF